MLTKNQIKLITSLTQKKYRKQEQLFIAEGVKVISEFLDANYELEHLYYTEAIFEQVDQDKKTLVTVAELNKITALTTANNCLAVFKIPRLKMLRQEGLIVALDDIRDPGNLGTIIRLCDWFGISKIVCTFETVDVYNPKVVQATMGSMARVDVHYIDLEKFLNRAPMAVFGTFMDGENIYNVNLPKEGIVVLGNEANGISEVISTCVSQKIAIPRFGNLQQTESLNVATAAAIILSEFRRNFN
ncbi:TrmH family RNA methyltransferase [Flavobacterium sp.]|uniref:TrmH family RNA methyltransferase n=1 Tax=Flavobacterium sp. TaxID=239 RepID=UPI003D13A762